MNSIPTASIQNDCIASHAPKSFSYKPIERGSPQESEVLKMLDKLSIERGNIKTMEDDLFGNRDEDFFKSF